MPSTPTMTAFYSFSPLQTIQSAHFNNNFDLIRGHYIPIDGSLSAFSNGNYNLGDSSYYWNQLYAAKKNVVAVTTGACNVTNTTADIWIMNNTSDATCTLGPVNVNTNTCLTFKSINTGKVYISGTIDGQPYLVIQEQYGFVRIACDGTAYYTV